MKRCGGEYTLDDAIAEAKTLEEMAEAASAFPNIVRTDTWTDKQAALDDVAAKAKQEADGWCSKRDCKIGDCHQIGKPEIKILDIGETKVTEGSFKGLTFYSVTAKVTKVTCGCQIRKEKEKSEK